MGRYDIVDYLSKEFNNGNTKFQSASEIDKCIGCGNVRLQIMKLSDRDSWTIPPLKIKWTKINNRLTLMARINYEYIVSKIGNDVLDINNNKGIQ